METMGAKLQQQEALEKQSAWVLATPAMPITPEKSPTTGPRDLNFSETATSSPPNEVQNHNVGSHQTILLNPTPGFSPIHFENVLVLTNPTGMQNIASFAWNDQPLALSNGKLLLSGSICHGDSHLLDRTFVGFCPNLRFTPEEAACTSNTKAMPVLVAPVTPAKGNKTNDSIQMHKEVEELIRGRRKEAGETQCYTTVHHDSSKLVASATPDKGKEIEDNIREVITPVDVDLIRNGNSQGGDQSEQSSFKKGTSSQELGVKLPTHASVSSVTSQLDIEQDEERINQGRELSSTTKKKGTRKRHRPKVLKDGLLTSKKPVTPQRVGKKREGQTGKRSYMRKNRSSNCPNTPSDTPRDTGDTSGTVSKSANQRTDNETKFIRRKLDFASESQPVDEYLEHAFTKSASQARGRCSTDSATCCRAKLNVQLGEGLEVEVENSGTGIAFDLNCSINQVLEESIRLPEDPSPLHRPSRRELLKKNWKYLARKSGNANSTDDSNFVGVSNLQNVKFQLKSDGDSDMTLMQDEVDYKQVESNYSTYPTSSDTHLIQPWFSNIPRFPQECKRRRTGTGHDGQFGQMARRDFKLFSSADEQKLIPTTVSQSPDFMLSFGQTKRATKKRSKIPIRAHKLVRNVTTAGCDYSLETPESRHQACMGSLFADAHVTMRTGKRTQRKRAHLKAISTMDHEDELVHFHEPVGLTSTSEDLQNFDFLHLHIIPVQECRRRSNILEPFGTNQMSQAIVPYTNQTDNCMAVAAEPQYSLVSYDSSMMVPYTETYSEIKRKRPRAKVDLDGETNRVWNLLMGKMVSDAEGPDMDREVQWGEQRQVFCGRADSFIARMRLIQGDRHFSPWKGSVLDSVIGVFLTQNVSDHLSSSAFMALAAKFPFKSRTDNVENRMSTLTEEYGSIPFTDDIDSLFVCHIGDVEVNKMDKANESTRINVKGDDLDNFFGQIVHAQGREVEVSLEAPNGRIEISIPIAENSESEAKRSLDDAVSSQTSVSSSVGSLNCTNHDTSFVGLTPHELLDIGLNGSVVSGSHSYASCQGHIQISGVNVVQEICNQDNDGNMLSEKCGALDQESEEERGIVDGLNSHGDPCQEISSTSNYQVNCSRNFSSCVPIVASESSDSDNIENADVIKMKSISSLLSSDPGSNNTHNKLVQRSFKDSSMETDSESRQRSSSMSNVTVSHDTCPSAIKQTSKSLVFSNADEITTILQQGEMKQYFQVVNSQHEVEFLAQKQHCQPQESFSNSCDDGKGNSMVTKAVEPDSKVQAFGLLEFPTEKLKGTPRVKKTKAESQKAKTFDWDSLRKEVCHNGYMSERSKDRMDSLDWDAVRCSDIREISETIRERGMNNVLAERIKDFLNRLLKDHGSLDLEWLRNVPPDKAKDYLLSIRGLGLKSVECVRLLTLHQHAFPVDTNVGRICVRLGWVPLQPLPESLQLHLLDLYPVLETIQKYLWPRLCTLDQRTLYELHYQMITFGKVFCTKSKPNCNACPMRGDCRHFASAFASARLALPGPEERRLVKSTVPNASETHQTTIFDPMPLSQIEESCFLRGIRSTNEPIIEEPPSPEHEFQGTLENEIEEVFYEDPCEIPTINLNLEEFTQNLQNYMLENMELQEGEIEKALVAITNEAASIPMPKLKNVKRLRTEHLVYELPDAHPLLEGLEPREYDDPCPYLLGIWAPGETAQSTEPPGTCCNSQEMGRICNDMTCFACSCRREEQTQTVRGTLLIPCRTANRGSFPLNGTYFQVNEVFADHQSSHSPLVVPRRLLWNLPRRTVYFGTSIPTIFRGLTTDEIRFCFWRGFVCLRGIDRQTRAPKPLSPRLHLAASHAQKKTSMKVGKKTQHKTASKS
ncbi:protein ROS1C-like [Musa acuminata AAA Group]|uniref:(wild Malaysian banana) hypothetical protein n=1 Tax=Musa acuminata subsp. malaccensis TaxID=214687 RepID=A0A804IFL4_MUSAM|nr:PREDICTED: transcriptional activator DEMETER-like [Musa acuminata subsp. malaccensis]CAG1851109.1 unnamed protein product [Musa acuminata subsp. malaccensis]